MPSALFRPQDRPLLNLTLLAATAVTTFGAFLITFGGDPGPTSSLIQALRNLLAQPEQVHAAMTFAGCLLLVLGSHEMGHYVFARIHGVDSSLPYFIPFPLGIGTLGAVIRLRGRIPNRNALVDIGAAGPLAGLIIAIPLIAIGVSHAQVIDTPVVAQSFPPDASLWGVSRALVQFAWDKIHHVPPGPELRKSATVFGDNLLVLGIRHLLVGPLPAGKDLVVNPTFLAGWFGLLVTMLNLIPIGQLDGGHVSFAVFGGGAVRLGKIVAVLFFGLCLFGSAGLLVWLFVAAKLVGFRHPELMEPTGPLTPGRKVVCALCLIGLIVCLMPVPITVVNT